MLVCLTFAAFQSDADAQTRRSNGSGSDNKSAVTRKQTARPAVSKPSGPERRPSTMVKKPSGQTKPSGQNVKPGNQSRPARITRPGRPTDRPSDRPTQHNPSVRPDTRPGAKPQMTPGHGPQKPVQIRPDRRHEPPRIHPRDRDFMRWDKPGYFWSRHDHCYGRRVRVLPSHVIRHIFHGHTYYCYNDIWYRPYGSHYIVCRPPYGTVLAANLVADMAWAAVNMAYYESVAQQNSLGLVQSYAAAGTEYFYQDGVFYAKDSSGQYKIIVPPAGALVETLPEDFDMVTLSDGKEYYKVDNTIYQVTVSDGKPYFEVIGQQAGL